MDNKIDRMRSLLGLSRKEFSEIYGLKYRTVTSWENGRRNTKNYVEDLLCRVMAQDLLNKTEKEADKYFHHGTPVGALCLDDGDPCFLDILSWAKIQPKELPFLARDYVIYTFPLGGLPMYACYYKTGGIDHWFENVLLTRAVPEDGFKALIVDIRDQIRGVQPSRMVSRLYLAISDAKDNAAEWLKDHRRENNILSLDPPTEEEKKEMHWLRMMTLNQYGYTEKTIEQIYVDKESLNLETVREMLRPYKGESE